MNFLKLFGPLNYTIRVIKSKIWAKIFYLLILIIINLNCDIEKQTNTDNSSPIKSPNTFIGDQHNFKPTFSAKKNSSNTKTPITKINTGYSEQTPLSISKEPNLQKNELPHKSSQLQNKEDETISKDKNEQNNLDLLKLQRPKYLKSFPWHQNNCYITAVLSSFIPVLVRQVGLPYFKDLRNEINKNPDDNDKAMIAFIDIVLEMYDENNLNTHIKQDTLNNFRKLFGKIAPEFDHSGFDDSRKFYQKLVSMHDYFSVAEKSYFYISKDDAQFTKNSRNDAKLNVDNFNDFFPLGKAIAFTYESKVTCSICQNGDGCYLSQKECLTILPSYNVTNTGSIFCDVCKKNQPFILERTIVSTPNIITIHTNEAKGPHKKLISFENFKYELVGCIVHKGYHYYSYIYEPKIKTWFKEDDFNKQFGPVKSINEDMTLLIYEKIEA